MTVIAPVFSSLGSVKFALACFEDLIPLRQQPPFIWPNPAWETAAKVARGALKRYAAVKTPEAYLWDVRVTNVGDGWRLEPIPKVSRNALEALGLTVPETLPAAPAKAQLMD